jgi:hypothetical protein
MYNNHIHTRYHGQQKSELKFITSEINEMNKMNEMNEIIKMGMIYDRRILWSEIENKMLKFFQMTKDSHFL